MQSVIDMVSLSKSTIWRLVKQGKFPTPIQLSERRRAWRMSDVVDWIDARVSRCVQCPPAMEGV